MANPNTLYDKVISVYEKIRANIGDKADKPTTFTTGNLAEFDNNGNPMDSGKSLDDISQEIQDAIEYAMVVDDRLVPTDGPGTSVIETFQSGVTTWLSTQLPDWASNANKNTAIFRNRPVNNNYYYNCPDLLNRVVLWIGDVNKEGGQTAGYMERSLVFPKAGVYSVDVEYAVGLTYQQANAPRFLVSVGGVTQEVVGTRQTNVLQTGHLIFNVQAGSRAIRLTATPDLGVSENAAAVVIASLKVTLVKEIGIEIGDIVPPEASAQTGQAADAKATYEQFAGKATKADATLTERGDPSTPGFSAWTIDGFPSGWTYSQPAYNKNEEFPSQSYWAIAITSPEGDTYNETANVADPNAVELNFGSGPGMSEMIATRTALQGYQLGNDDQHILASEAEAEALRAGKLSITSTAPQFQDEEDLYQPGRLVVYNGSLYVCTQQHYGPWNADHFSAQDVVDSAIGRRVDSKVDKITVYTTNNLASIDEFGSIADSGIAKENVALTADIPYSLVTKTISNNAVTLDDRTFNKVTVPDGITEVILNPPAEIPGKVRDFRLLLICGQNSPAITYGGYIIVVSEQDVNLPPPPGLNVYTFSEISRNQFIVTRKTPVVKSDNAPRTIESLSAAMAAMGYDTDAWTTLDDIRMALELPDTASIVDCVQKALYE